jgi:hypothetical protein
VQLSIAIGTAKPHPAPAARTAAAKAWADMQALRATLEREVQRASTGIEALPRWQRDIIAMVLDMNEHDTFEIVPAGARAE